ncbi:MAG: YbaB/EbfC family nucleoid-associated protein [Acidobacteriaceae bacterium]
MEIDMNKMQEMLAQARQMQQTMDQRLADSIVEADSGGGAVKARMNGRKELLSLSIAPSAVQAAASDLTLLEDLIVAAVNACARKADDVGKSSAAGILGSLGLPGI